MELKEIAVIHTDFRKVWDSKTERTCRGIAGNDCFSPEYRNADAIRGLNDFSHLWLVWGFSKAKKITGLPPSDLRGSVEKCVWVSLQHAPLSVLTRLVYLP